MKKIESTRNYRLFRDGGQNRLLNIKKCRKLLASMKKYGFLEAYPIIVARNDHRVLDGQLRLAIAETLGLPVYYVEVDASDYEDVVITYATRGSADSRS